MRKRFFSALLVVMFGLPAAVLAGTTGRITGAVKDGDGVPIAGASVTVASPSQTQSTVTDARGSFSFISLPPDTY